MNFTTSAPPDQPGWATPAPAASPTTTPTAAAPPEAAPEQPQVSPARDAARRQHEYILAARDLLKPSPVRLHRMPRWFRLACLRNLPNVSRGLGSSTYAAQVRLRQYLGGALDHWGTTTWAGKPAFVVEPYDVTADTLTAAAEVARLIGCRWAITPQSWWYPSRTIRIVWWPAEEGTGR